MGNMFVVYVCSHAYFFYVFQALHCKPKGLYSSRQIKCESLVTTVTLKYCVMWTHHHFGVKYMPNSE